jgi:senataxin
MHPFISRWPRVQFYEGKITDGENVQSLEYSKDWHEYIPPLSWYDLREGKDEVNQSGSKYNELQAELVRQLLFI